MLSCVRRGLFTIVCLGFSVGGAAADTATRIVLGRAHACALTAGGGVVCWGENVYNQLGDGTTTYRAAPTPVSGLASGVIAIAAGDSHSCAVTSGGAVLCWGENSSGQIGDGFTAQRPTPTPVSGLSSGVATVAAGSAHTCVLTTTGAVRCWGRNAEGQLGDGTKTPKLTSVAVSGFSSGVASIVSGYEGNCALMTTGAVKCWGDNAYGQVGNNSTTDMTTPTSVSGLAGGVAAVASGSYHACAITTGGALLCWGYNGVGTVGDGTKTNRLIPAAVSGMGSGVSAVGLGHTHSCAVVVGGSLRCWGANGVGQVGDGSFVERVIPTQVSGLTSGIAAVDGGTEFTCALGTGGDIRCWGGNAASQLGIGIEAVTRRKTAAPVIGLGTGVAVIETGWMHSCALTTTGGVLCWGDNRYGQLGDGTTTVHPVNRPVPGVVVGLTSGVAAIAVGGNHACALTTGGAVRCWGQNATGQVGDDSTTNRPTPTQVSGLTSGIAAIAAGDSHTCAVTTEGAVKCWGANFYGQVGDNSMTTRRTPTPVSGLTGGIAAVSSKGHHTCVRTTLGAAKCWGYNSRGQLGDDSTTTRLTPVGVSGLTANVTAISGGYEVTCALTTGGATSCWGSNTSGQIGDGTSYNRWVPTPVSTLGSGVAALGVGLHACAVTTGGGALCWGLNSDGQLGDDTLTNRNVPTAVIGLQSGIATIAAANQHTCAVTTAGAGLCWGSALYGMLGDGMWTAVLTPATVYGFGGGLAVSGITPAVGSATGGTSVRITGAYMLSGATVDLGGVAATGMTRTSPSELAAVTGPHSAGTVDVVVRNPDGSSATLPAAFTFTGGGGTPTFTDDPLIARTSPVKAVHVTELRQYVNDLRTRYSLPAFTWANTTLTPGTTPVRAIDIAELRTALSEAYTAAGRTPPAYTDATLTPGVTVVGATHVAELRAAVLSLW